MPVLSCEMKTPAQIESLSAVQAFLEEKLEEAMCPMKAQMQIAISVEEIFVNIAHYAYGEGTGDAVIRLESLADERGVVITFIDSGVPFDPMAKEDPDVTLSASDRSIGGLGIFLAKKNMDAMEYERRDGQNILRLVKKW